MPSHVVYEVIFCEFTVSKYINCLLYTSKFMKAEGGLGRIVWMPKALKDQVAERVNESAKELYGIDNFCDMVGDETIAEDPETLMAFLTEKGHPALSMDPLM